MAEYINYGDQQIDLLAFNDIINDESKVNDYINSQSWSTKRKNYFRDNYYDIRRRGITGASIEKYIDEKGKEKTGWVLHVNGKDPDFRDKKDREMLGAVAAYFQELMELLAKNLKEKKSEENKPEEEKKKEVFDFNKQFELALLNSFGGNQAALKDNWASLDSELDNGLYSRAGRAAKIKDALKSLLNSIQDKKEDYDFNAYGGFEEFSKKLEAAISALDNPDTARDALLSLGVNYKGLLDDYADQKIPLSDGTEITRAEYAAQQIKQLKEELAKVAKKEELIKQGNRGVVTLTSGIHGTDVRTQPEAYSQYLAKKYGTGQQGYNKINQEILGLLNKAYNNGEGNGLTAEEKRKLGNFLFYIRANNPNSKAGNWNITPQEWELLGWSKYAKSKNLNDYIRLPWQTPDGRYTFADNQGNIFFVKTSRHLKLAFNRSQTYNNYKNNFLKSNSQLLDLLLLKNMNTPIAQLDGLTPELSRELGAIALDFGAMINPGAVTGTAMALSAAGLREQNRLSGFSWEKVFDWGTAALGGLPVLGDILSGSKTLYKLGKLVNTSAEVAGYMTTILGTTVGVVLAKNIVTKLANDPTSLNTQDLLNIAYGLMGIVGGAKTVRAIKSGKAYNQANSTIENTISVKTSSGKTVKIKVDDNEAKQIASVYKSAKNNTEANLKVIEIVKNKTSENLEGAKIQNGAGSIRGSEIGRKLTSTPNPILKRYIPNEGSNYPVSWLSMVNPLRAKILNRRVVPQENEKGFFKRVNELFFGNYEPKSISKPTETSKPVESSQKVISQENNSQKTIIPDKEVIKAYRGLFKNQFSKNPIQSGSASINGNNIKVVEQPDGSFNLLFKGEIVDNFNNQQHLLTAIRDIIKNNRKIFVENASTKKIDIKEMGKILKDFKQKGWLKQGGTIDKLRILKYKEYIKK